MSKLRNIALAVMFLVLATGATFSPGEYPQWYLTGKTSATTGTASLLASDVIYAGPKNILYGGCTVINTAASAQFYILYNSATVAAQATTNIVGFIKCGAGLSCALMVPGVTGPTLNGGLVYPGAGGLSWANSSTYPTKTAGSADSAMWCIYSVQ
jgi:hypothetical protein